MIEQDSSKTANVERTPSTMACLAESFLLWRRYCQLRIKPLGMSVKQAFILGQLTQSDLNPSQIADLLFTDRATVSVMLQTMTKRGWIKKEKDASNRKFVRISITPLGREKLEELRAFEKKLPKREDPFKGFSRQEKADLQRLANQLRARMEELPRPETKGDIDESNT
jgi:MarR family transcriptional regulator, organic hydroperoxide resistance regulator